MKYFRHLIPILGILALLALFLKLPETSKIFNALSCKTCSLPDPYLPLVGSAYFATLIAISLFFPRFPRPQIARSGLIWAVLLALVLTYIDFPQICVLCLIGHACNISIWTIWTVTSSTKSLSNSSVKERLYLVVFAPISIAALFGSLNLTFMAYGFKTHPPIPGTGLQIGDAVPSFSTRTSDGQLITCPASSRMLINFISPDCPHCKEQLKVLDTIIPEIKSSACRFINITPFLSSELVAYSPSMEWVEDKVGDLSSLFNVPGYPTLFVVGSDSKIVQIIPGVHEDLKNLILASLFR
jgi:hypothetical protein